jgi:hypothetical protein
MKYCVLIIDGASDWLKAQDVFIKEGHNIMRKLSWSK